jgi:Rrf2 family nitric oxide-sensitive transcriptional repressor
MKITRYTDYSLRVLLYLGLHDDRLCSVAEIAERYAISRSHLTKVVNMLGHLGVIETHRGRNGGLRLARRPEEIRLGVVMRRTEGHGPVADCEHCTIHPACRLPNVLDRALEAFFSVFDDYTVADILKPRTGLLKLLG